MDYERPVFQMGEGVNFMEVMLSLAKLGKIRWEIDRLTGEERLHPKILDRIALIDGTFAEINDHIQEVLSVTS